MKELPCGLLWPGSEPLPFEPAFLEVALCDSAGFLPVPFHSNEMLYVVIDRHEFPGQWIGFDLSVTARSTFRRQDGPMCQG